MVEASSDAALGPSSSRAVARLRPSRGCLAWVAMGLVSLVGLIWILTRPDHPEWRDGQPMLRMPFPRGTVVLCEQGNAAASGTHAKASPQNTFALDFSNATLDPVRVVAAAPGVVTFLVADAPSDDFDAGAGYGNQVRVSHHDGFFTFYSHLDEVRVRAGQRVNSGDVLGTMGRSGAAGGRHLHFSLHRTAARGPGVRESLSISGILAARVDDAPLRFEAIAGVHFRAHHAVPWKGGVYASENGPGSVVGAPSPELMATLDAAAKRLRSYLSDRVALSDVARLHDRHDSSWAARRIEPILSRSPENPVALYLHASAVLIPERRLEEAREALTLAVGQNQAGMYEGWLPAFSEAQLGIVAFEAGDQDEARRRMNRALDSYTSERLLQHVLPYLRRMPAVERRAADAGTDPAQ